MERKIAWSKYHDPIGDDITDAEWPGAFGKQLTKDEEEDLEYLGVDLELARRPENQLRQHAGNHLNVMMTPHGPIPVTEHNSPSKCFNLWTLHTNFDLTPNLLDEIEEVPGVEILNVFSRYRAIVGFGHLFKSADVKVAIGERLGIQSSDKVDLTDPVVLENLATAKRQVLGSKKWTIFMLPNGKVSTAKIEDGEGLYNKTVAMMKEIREGVGGHLVSSDEESEA